MTDTSALTVWVAIIAVAQLVTMLLMVGMAIALWRAWTKTERALRMLEREYLEPIMLKVHRTAEDAQVALARVSAADDDVRQALASVKQGAQDVLRQVRHGVWPAVGIARGVQAAMGALLRPSGRIARPAIHASGHHTLATQRGEAHARS